MSAKSELPSSAPACVSRERSLSRVLLYVAESRQSDIALQNDSRRHRELFKHEEASQAENLQALAPVDECSFRRNIAPNLNYNESPCRPNADENVSTNNMDMMSACGPPMASYVYGPSSFPSTPANANNSLDYRSRLHETYNSSYPINDNATTEHTNFHSSNSCDSVPAGKLTMSSCENTNNILPTNCHVENSIYNRPLDPSIPNPSFFSYGQQRDYHRINLHAYNHQARQRRADSPQPFNFNLNANSLPLQMGANMHLQMDSGANGCHPEKNNECNREVAVAQSRTEDGQRQCSVPPYEGEIVVVNNVPHQFVRTAEGMVLAVIGQPPQQSVVNNSDVVKNEKVFDPSDNNFVQTDGDCAQLRSDPFQSAINAKELFSDCRDSSYSVVVPFGWRRIINGCMVFYISPSGAILGGMEQLREYLQTAGTCKCGLECPLLAEQAFNFDPKVPSRPYEMQSEATQDLTKLCNHKRKLLAMVSASLAQQQNGAPSAQAPPPSETMPKVADSPVSKKKKKKKASPYSGTSVSQLLAQKEQMHQQQCFGAEQQPHPVDRMWLSDGPDANRTMSPTIPLMRSVSQSCPSEMSKMNASAQPNIQPAHFHNLTPQDNSNAPTLETMQNKQNVGSHYITVNNGMLFNAAENHQKLANTSSMPKSDGPVTNNSPANYPGHVQTNNIINHVIGPNGQIIGVHTNGNALRNMNVMNNLNEGKKYMSNVGCSGSVQIKTETTKKQTNTSLNQDETSFSNMSQSTGSQGVSAVCANSHPNNNTSVVQNNSAVSQGLTNVLIGPNPQVLTPEVVQRINQQQQMFIQQNQKQIEMAMKGIRTQFIANNSQMNSDSKQKTNIHTNQNNQPQPQGQLIIQNGTVMLANQQSKTSQWHFNKINDPPNAVVQNNQKIDTNSKPGQSETYMTCPNMSINVPQQNNMVGNYSGRHISSQGQMMNQNVFSRVPPIHPHCVQPIWNEEVSKKKKQNKNNKKARQFNNDSSSGTQCSNVNILHMGQNRNGYSGHNLNAKSPSFMEDPSGYLAQQTALLNSTISRKIEVHSNVATSNIPHNIANINQSNNYMFSQETSMHSSNKTFNQRASNEMQNINLGKTQANVTDNRPPPQCLTPDSSNQSEKIVELSQQNQFNPNNCRGCFMSMSNNNNNRRNVSHAENQIKCDNSEGTVRPSSGFMPKSGSYTSSSFKTDSGSQPGTPSSSNLEENPVTSSTILERSGNMYNQGFSDSRGPIQGGTISTSNGSPIEAFQLPEPSPTPSNSSRNTDTPQSNNSSSTNLSSGGSFAMPSPAHSNQGSSRDSNPATPTPMQNSFNNFYNSGPLPNQQPPTNNNQSRIGNESDNSAPQVIPNLMNIQGSHQQKQNTQMFNSLSERKFSPNNTFTVYNNRIPSLNSSYMTTMASSHTVIRDTITSVLAGKAQTATTSITASSNSQYGRPPMMNLNQYSNQNLHQAEMSNNMHMDRLPSGYPMHLAGTVAQTMISKSPLEMVQSIVSSIKVSQSPSSQAMQHQMSNQNVNPNIKVNTQSQNISAPQILMSSNGQLIVAGSNQGQVMPPPPPKGQVISPLPSLAASNLVTNATGTVTQGVQQVINQPTMLVNTMPAPFVIQPQMLTVDGQMVAQNTVLPQLMANSVINQGSSAMEAHSPGQLKAITQNIHRATLLPPDTGKRKSKKKKVTNQQSVGVLQLATQHSPGSVILQQGSQQTTQQFSPQSFQVSPNQNMQATPVLQALTIVPGKAGTPAHILMNGQPTAGNFSSQPIITNSQPPQQINLLQPVNLLNSTTSVVQNFPTFQQFIVPGLGSMVMTADGTLIQDTSGMPVQLQIQHVNGQNVLTPVQNQGILATGNTGMVIRTPSGHSKIVQTQHSPGTQFLSPNSQIVVNNTGFSGQLSPLIANVSPNQSMTFSTSPQHVRSSNVQQDFIQCNQMGQTLMVPVQSHQMPVSSAASQGNTTFVQQNTTIVQQQTTMVSNNQHPAPFQTQNLNSSESIIANAGASTLSIDPAMLLNHSGKQVACQNKNKNQVQVHNQMNHQIMTQNFNDSTEMKRLVSCPQIINQFNVHNAIKNEHEAIRLSSPSPHLTGQVVCNNNPQIINSHAQAFMGNNYNERHSVSTQTLLHQQQNSSDSKSPPRNANYQQISGSSPPDTTTHSPLGPLEGNSSSPSLPLNRSVYAHGNHADTTTKSPEPNEVNTLAMVQCVSSSEPDTEKETSNWQSPQSDFVTGDANLQPSQQMNRCYSMEASNVQYSHQNMPNSMCQQNIATLQTHYFQRNNLKRKNDEEADHVKFANEKVMRFTSNLSHLNSNDNLEYKGHSFVTGYENKNQESMHKDMYTVAHPDAQKNLNKMDIANLRQQNMQLVHTNDTNADASNDKNGLVESDQFEVGDLVWGPAKGYPAWPGKLMSTQGDHNFLVRWFGGDRSLALVKASALKTLSEGLEAHHAARTKCRKSRKLNAQLEKAIQEAMVELDKMSESKKNKIKRDNMGTHLDKVSPAKGSGQQKPSQVHNNNTIKVKHPVIMKNTAISRTVPIKIAPHPSGQVQTEVSGRLRSSQQR